MTRPTIAAVCLLLVFATAAFGLQVGGERGQPTTVLLDFGFAGKIRGSEWAPVRIAVSPMDDAVQAVARIRIETADGGRLTSVVPVATTPGRETIVPATLWIPPSISALYVDLIADGGRSIASTSYGPFAGSQSIQLPVVSTAPLIVGVASPSLRLAFGERTYERDFEGSQGAELRSRTATARVASTVPATAGGPPWLPTTPIAYNQATAVVIDGQVAGSLDPDGVRALREWVVSGGRFMLVNADNTALRQILGAYTPSGLRVLPAEQTRLPESLGGPGMVLSRPVDTGSLPAGWSLPASGGGHVAQGPVGLGWMMLLGFDPDGLADEELLEATEVAWHGSLAVMIEDELQDGRRRLSGNYGQAVTLGEIARYGVMNWIGRSPTVGMGAFVAIFAMMIGLAIALGPIDRLVLRRLGALSRWWLAAVAWIALASVGAWVAPTVVRSGPTTVSSVRIVDGWRPADAAPRAWQHTFDGMFLNQSARVGLGDLETGAWLSPLTHDWMAGGVGTLVMVPQGSTMKPQPTAARLWTTRLFEQQGPTTTPVNARFEVENERFTLGLDGPMASAVEVAAVRTGGRWLHMLPGGTPRREGNTVVLRATRSDLTTMVPRPFDTDEYLNEDAYYGYWGYEPVREGRPGLVARIGRGDHRSRALDALASSEEWAVVYLSWKDSTPQLGSDVGEEFDTRWVCRLAVPVERAGGAGGTP